jgi:hypothetical protein
MAVRPRPGPHINRERAERPSTPIIPTGCSGWSCEAQPSRLKTSTNVQAWSPTIHASCPGGIRKALRAPIFTLGTVGHEYLQASGDHVAEVRGLA